MKGFTSEWLKEHQARCKPSSTKPEHTVLNEPVAKETGEGKDTAGHIVRICSFRHRLLDPDNLTGGVKYFVDAIRYSQLIPGDAPDQIKLEVSQVKIGSEEEERTEIEIISNETLLQG